MMHKIDGVPVYESIYDERSKRILTPRVANGNLYIPMVGYMLIPDSVLKEIWKGDSDDGRK